MKKKFFSKLKDYNYILDKVLEDKNFSEDAKNLLLNMIYKIEVSYKDYAQIKVVYEKKKHFIDELIKIVSDKCRFLFLIDPSNQEVKMLKEKNVLALTNEREKRIYAYPTELAVLTGIIDINPKYFYISKKYYYIKSQLQRILVEGTILNFTEVIRNFNGWSWNVAEDANIDHTANMIYQAIRIMIDEDYLTIWEQDSSGKIDYINELRKEFSEYYGEENSRKFYMALCKLIVSYSNEEEQKKLDFEFQRINEAYKKIRDKNKYIYMAANERRKIESKINENNSIINSRELLNSELQRRNRLQKKKIFSISDLVDILQEEIELYEKRIQEINEYAKPSNYDSLKSDIEEKYEILSSMKSGKKTRDFKIEFQKVVLDCFAYDIEKINSKEEILDIIYKLRYYRKIRVTKDEKVEDIPELYSKVKQILKFVITKGCKNKIFNIFCKDIDYNYRIIEVALDTAISNYEDVDIALDLVNGKLQVSVFDNEIIDKQQEIDFLVSKKDIDVKLGKQIPLYNI